MPDLIATAGDIFGFSKWTSGLGKVGNFILWFVGGMILVGIFALLYYWYTMKKVYRESVWTFGIVGNSPQLKWLDKAKYVGVGKAGDRLFLLKKSKRFIPPPTLQTGPHLWFYWEREDGELINVTLDDLDSKMKRMGVKFIDADMRMQRLGIEKNLAYRLQKQTFWEKYGDKVINMVFYVFVMIILIVLFVQWRKTAGALGGIAETVREIVEEAKGLCKPEKSSSGVIPAFALLLINELGLNKNGS